MASCTAARTIGWTKSSGRPFTGFTRPTAVAALPDGRIAVTELGADAVTDSAGAANAGSISVLGADGTRVASRTGLDRPEGVVADGQAGVLVAETQRDRILQLRIAGDHLVQVAEFGGAGSGRGRFARPMGMALFPDGDLLVADTYNNRLQRFERTEQIEAPTAAAGTVPATLALSLPGPAELGTFVPGATRDYDATLAADVISTAGDAALTVSDPDPVTPGRLLNGAVALAQPVAAAADPAPPMPLGAAPLVLTTFAAPVSHAHVAIRLRQTIRANDPLRTGRYAKSLTFTLSTTTP